MFNLETASGENGDGGLPSYLQIQLLHPLIDFLMASR